MNVINVQSRLEKSLSVIFTWWLKYFLDAYELKHELFVYLEWQLLQMITAVPENLHWIWAACCFYTEIHRKMTDSLNIIPGLFRHDSYESSQKLFLLLCLFRKYFRFSEFGYAYPWQDSFGQENEYFVFSLFNFESIYKMYKVQIT